MESLRRWPRRLTGASPRLHRGRASVGGVGGGREVPPCVLRSSSLHVDKQRQASAGERAGVSEPGIRKRPFSGWQPQPPPNRHGPTPTDPPTQHGSTTRRQCYRMPSWGGRVCLYHNACFAGTHWYFFVPDAPSAPCGRLMAVPPCNAATPSAFVGSRQQHAPCLATLLPKSSHTQYVLNHSEYRRHTVPSPVVAGVCIRALRPGPHVAPRRVPHAGCHEAHPHPLL